MQGGALIGCFLAGPIRVARAPVRRQTARGLTHKKKIKNILWLYLIHSLNRNVFVEPFKLSALQGFIFQKRPFKNDL